MPTATHPVCPPEQCHYINGMTSDSMNFEIMLRYFPGADVYAMPVLLSCIYDTPDGEQSLLIGRVNDAQFAAVDADHDRTENPLDLLPTEVRNGTWSRRSKVSSACEPCDRPLWNIETGYDQLLLGEEELEPR